MSERKKLPKGWRWAKLGDKDVAEIGAGNSAPQGLEYFEGGEYPFVRTQDVGREGKTPCLLETTNKLNAHALQTRTLRLWPEYTILIPKSGASTFLNHRAMLGRPAYVSSHLATIVPQESVLPEFLYFFSLTIDARNIAPDNDYPSLNLPNIAGVEIPLPPLAAQERIVEVLQQADAIRRKRAEASRLADQILPALFLDMFGDPVTNPKDWPVEAIGNLLAPEIERVNPSKAFHDEDFTYIEIAHIDNIEFRITTQKRLLGKNAPSRARQVVRTGDVLYSMTRPNLRNIAVVPEELDGAIATTGFAILRPKKPHDTSFIFEMVKNSAFTNAMAHFAEAKSLYPAVDEPEIRRYEIMTPPHGLRAQFAENYESLADLGTNTRHSNGISSSLFSNVLSRAFTGELTADWEATNEDWIVERQAFYERLPRLALLSLLLERRQRAGRDAVTLITALMKYAFLSQMEGELRRHLYRFVPYHYGPCAMDIYDDLKALADDGLISVENDAGEDKTRIALTDPERAAALLEAEARKDDALLSALEEAQKDSAAATDPVAARLLKRRAEILETLRTDAATILDAYGDLDHNALLKTVYEKYPAYAKKSRLRKGRSKES